LTILSRSAKIGGWQSGPVAQLGARFHGMEEVVGSIPTRSTILPENFLLVQDHKMIIAGRFGEGL
jgi:hypothetical protein